MTRLLKSIGLLIAFSFLSFNSYSAFLDSVPFQAPKTESSELYKCSYYTTTSSPLGQTVFVSNLDACFSHIIAVNDYLTSVQNTNSCTLVNSTSVWCAYETNTGTPVTSRNRGTFVFDSNVQSSTCPPDLYPTYTYEYDSNLDGKTDKCLNPVDLVTSSNCLSAPNILPLFSGAPTSSSVCINQSNGGQCGYRNNNNGSFVRDSSIQCFDDEIPAVNPPDTPEPTDGQCLPFGSGFVCAADPSQVCTSNVCPDNCGWQSLGGGANSFAKGGGQFVCFTNEPKLPEKETNPNGNTDPDDPETVTPEDETNALSKDISKVTNRLGELISLTRDKGNDMIYAINKQTGELMGSARDSNSLATQTNQLLTEISSKLNGQTETPDNGPGDIVAAVDRNTGEIISVMREGQVKLAELGSNIILTKDIQQGVLTASQETKQEIVRGFDNIIQFMQTAEEPDPETGETPMDKLLKTNSDGFAEVQRLLDELLTKPGIESPGGGSSLPTDPDTGAEIVPDAADFRFDSSTVQIAPDSTAIDAKIEESKLSFINKVREIRDLFSSKFSSGISGGGSLPSLGFIDYDTVHVDVNLAPYADQLSMIGLALIFMATLTGLFVIFR